jgi:hypothetical protein
MILNDLMLYVLTALNLKLKIVRWVSVWNCFEIKCRKTFEWFMIEMINRKKEKQSKTHSKLKY